LLEQRAISQKVALYYEKELEHFRRESGCEDLVNIRDEVLDSHLVTFFNRQFLAGEQADQGEKLMASIMHAHPAFGRYGSRKLARSWRALKGWRKLTPARSRVALPLGFWCALAWAMKDRGETAMCVYTLLLVSS